MEREWLVRIERSLIGRHGSIARRETDWAFNLDGNGSISLPVPWRIVANGRIAFADKDDGQWFGLPAPVDGEALVNQLLVGNAITGITINAETADLSLQFGGNVRLEAFNHSAGYEGWQINLPSKSGGMWIIALGGGDVSIFAE